ncbi:hypothetical protein [Streptomyces sp. T028]|uniref:hypothetical protein n=1 Tax=Streptomyces sp. T028 TaxID=3394379 RepID=UPI003A8A02E4
MSPSAQRIDVHQHVVPDFYQAELAKAGIADAGGRALPDWTPESALELMAAQRTAARLVFKLVQPGTD